MSLNPESGPPDKKGDEPKTLAEALGRLFEIQAAVVFKLFKPQPLPRFHQPETQEPKTPTPLS